MNRADQPRPPTGITGEHLRRLEAFPEKRNVDTDIDEILDSIHDAVLVHDIATGRVQHANAAACRMYGYRPADFCQLTIADLSDGEPPHSGAEARHWWDRAATRGAQVFEWRARAADGHRFWVEVALSAGPASCPGRCFATMRDISTRKDLAAERERDHAALRQSEERFRLLLGRMPNLAIQGCGPDGVVRYWNEASEQLYGYTAAEAIGRSLVSLIVPPPNRDEMLVALHQMMASGQGLAPDELQLQRKDGSLVPVFSGQVVVNLPGSGPELFRLDFDLRDRKRAETERLELERRLLQSQKLESLGVLAGGIAHDFNNLLTGVLGNLELVRLELPAESPTQPLVDDAITAGRMAANLTHQMLAYTGRSRFQLLPLDLNKIVRENEPLIHAAAARRAALQFFLAADLPAIEADAGQVGQAIVNLVTNAAESIEHLPGTIEIRTGEEFWAAAQLALSWVDEKPAPQRFVCLEVADTGCGMDGSTVQRAFDPFFSTKFAGRGLGLPVVLGIVRAHHGALLVDSFPGRGSVVRVLFPLARPPAPNADDMTGDDPNPTTKPLGLILVVDDEEPVRQIARRMAQRLGCDALTAPTGEAAVELCRQHAGELRAAIIDLTMPGMNGLDCLRALREIRPELPAALSSGYDRSEITERFDAGDFSCFLQKPFTFEQFTDTLKTLTTRTGPSPQP